MIENLTDENGLVVDPFGGSGTFAYAALDAGRHVRFNEWEPYAYKMSTAPFRGVPSSEEYCAALRFIAQRVEPTMNAIYKTDAQTVELSCLLMVYSLTVNRLSTTIQHSTNALEQMAKM